MAKKESVRFEEYLTPPELYKLKKTVPIQYDGKQYVIRIPQKIAYLLHIQRGQAFTFEVDTKKSYSSFTLGRKVFKKRQVKKVKKHGR